MTVDKRAIVAVGDFIDIRSARLSKSGKKVLEGLGLVREVHPKHLLVKVYTRSFGGDTSMPDPLLEVDRMYDDWKLR